MPPNHLASACDGVGGTHLRGHDEDVGGRVRARELLARHEAHEFARQPRKGRKSRQQLYGLTAAHGLRLQPQELGSTEAG